MDSADPNYSIRGFSGNMLGEFYGPAAEEVGGVLNGNRAVIATAPPLPSNSCLDYSSVQKGVLYGRCV